MEINKMNIGILVFTLLLLLIAVMASGQKLILATDGYTVDGQYEQGEVALIFEEWGAFQVKIGGLYISEPYQRISITEGKHRYAHWDIEVPWSTEIDSLAVGNDERLYLRLVTGEVYKSEMLVKLKGKDKKNYLNRN